MVEFIDKTSGQNGTPLNRENLMAIQGFIKNDIVFKKDGSIEEKNAKGETLTTMFDVDENGNNIIIETFVGKKTIKKITTFNNDGSISETII